MAEIIRTLTIRSKVEGAAQTQADLKGIASAHDAVAKVVDSSAKNQLSLEQAVARAERRFNSALRAQQDFEKIQRQMNLAVAQNPALQERANAVLAQAALHYGQAGVAAKAFAAATSGVSGQLVALSAGAGPVGVFLAALGPWGLAASVALGAVGAAIHFIAEESARMGQKAIDVRRFADVTGLAINEIGGLRAAGAQFGIAGDTVGTSFERLTGQLTDARRATGSLFDDVQRLGSGLADELRRTSTTAEGINVLARAYRSARDEAERASIARAVFGRGGAGLGPVLGTIADAGGIQNLKEANELTAAQTREWAKMQAEIDETNKRAKNILASIFTEEGLKASLLAAQTMERAAKAAKDLADQQQGLSWLDRLFIGLKNPFGIGLDSINEQTATLGARRRLQQGLGTNLAANDNDVASWNKLGEALRHVESPAQQTVKTLKEAQDEAAAAAKLERDRIAILGSAATIDEHRLARLKDINSALLDNRISQADANRAIAATNLDANLQRLQAMVGALGSAATVTDQYNLRLAQLRQELNQGKISQDTFNRAVEGLKADEQLRSLRDAVSALGDAATPAEQYALRIAELNRELERGAISQETFNRAVLAANPAVKQFSDLTREFATDLARDLLNGAHAVDAIRNALNKVSDKLLDQGFKDAMMAIFSADPVMAFKAAVELAIAAVIKLFNAESERRKAQQKADAERATKEMSGFERSVSFLNARVRLTGQDDLAAQLDAFDLEARVRRHQENLNGNQAINELEKLLSAERLKIIEDFNAKAKAAEEDRLGRLDQLQRALNEGSGKGFINDINDLLKTVKQGRADAAALGTSQDLVDRFFGVSAQKIIDDAGLVGDAFIELTNQFPELVGHVHEATKAIEDQAKAQEKLNTIAGSIVDYIRELQGGSSSTLSPTQVLANAQAAYAQNLTLAQGGNVDAQAKFTQLADNLEKAARAVYASGQQYQDIRNQIITEGLALPAVQNTTDPVVQALRDVEKAINGPGATSLLTSVNTLAKDSSITSTLVSAVNAGSAAALAQALRDDAVFKKVDADLSGAIDLEEMQTALGSSYTSGTIAAMFDALAGAKGIQGRAIRMVDVMDYDSANTLVTTMRGVGTNDAEGLRGLQKTAADQLALLNFQLTSGGVTLPTSVSSLSDRAGNTVTGGGTINNNMITALNKIVVNTEAIAFNTAHPWDSDSNTAIAPNFGNYHVGQLAAGGTIPPFGLALVSEHLNPAFLRAGPEPIQVFPGSPANDNGAMVAELRALRGEVQRLQTIVAGSNALVARAVVESGEGVEGAVADGMGKVAFETRQNKRKDAA